MNTKMSVQKALSEMLSKITPARRELKPVQQFLQELNTQLTKNNLNAKAVLGGSFAKGVWLEKDYDVDIFVQFKKNSDNLSDELEKILKKWTPERVHGSRDYFRIHNNGYTYEIVPVLSIQKATDAVNVTDASPLHVQWMLKRGKKYQGDIRLAKTFCKAQKVYGAESYIGGFSGHVLDILVIHYKGFHNLLKAATKWKEKTLIDTEKQYKEKATRYMNTSKTEGPLIIVDPIDKTRNASAAVGRESFRKFIQASKTFLKTPSTEYFERKTILPKNVLVITTEIIEGKHDIVGATYKKIYESLQQKLEPFIVQDSDWEWTPGTKPTFWYKTEKKNVETVERKGPPITMKNAVEEFKKAHKKTITKKGTLYAYEPAHIKTREEAIQQVSKQYEVSLEVLRQ